MTNFEKIKNMSVEEMAIFINDTVPCQVCAFENENCLVENRWGMCNEGIEDWLESKAED